LSPHALRIRALVTDVDGTLTDADRHLSPAAMQLLLDWEARGIPVVLATGNVLPIALALHRSMGLSGPIVAENGGLIYRKLDGRETVERLADRAVAWRAYRKLRQAGLPVRRLFTDRWRETEVALEPNVEVRKIRSVLGGSTVRVEATGYATHLMQRGAGKLPALERALAILGLNLADCLVAGDGDNDVGMLRAAGFAVSFASGSPRARKAADYVSGRSYANGFVDALMSRGVVSRLSKT
jgi:phosphoglycolate phosphatase (TIGR01487 family)